jgi:hypothetical protein
MLNLRGKKALYVPPPYHFGWDFERFVLKSRYVTAIDARRQYRVNVAAEFFRNLKHSFIISQTQPKTSKQTNLEKMVFVDLTTLLYSHSCLLATSLPLYCVASLLVAADFLLYFFVLFFGKNLGT